VAGARATSSHTGALLSASDVTIDALFEQAGVIRTDTLHELFGVAELLSTQPVPRGARVAIVSNAGGPGIMCADACQADGVDVPELAPEVQSELAGFLPAAAALGNPVDMIATASGEDYRRALRALIDNDACDAILTIFVPALVTEAVEVATAISDVAQDARGVPIAAVFMTTEPPPGKLAAGRVRVPAYEFAEDAARAVALAARHGRWRATPVGTVPRFGDVAFTRAAAIIAQELGRGTDWLAPDRVGDLLECYGLPLVQTRVVADAEQAVAAAEALGGPVALKAIAAGLVHKGDAGGVVLGLDGPAAVRDAAAEIVAALAGEGHRLEGFIVQPMVSAGVELIVGVVHDRLFGPVLACGAGGTTAELVKDVAVRITPVTDLDAHRMLRSLKTFPLLDGYRGAARCDLDAIEEVVLRVSAMVEAHPEIVELDCNPLIASVDRAVIVDARVRVEVAPPPVPMPSVEG